jgi:spore coat polysaccharide biosynthesis protein SpsF
MESMGIIIQARMSSRRCPGKVLRPLRGKPMLGYLVERLRRGMPGLSVVVATSSLGDDDPVETFCIREGVACHRGPLDDVAARFLETARRFTWKAFVRLSGDSPFLDPALVRHAVALYEESLPDLVTNVRVRTYPRGQSVEVVDTRAFTRACRLMSRPAHREHVTAYFYEHPDAFVIRDFRFGRNEGSVQLSVDTDEEFGRADRLLAAMTAPHWSYGVEDLLALNASLPGGPA